MIAYMIVLLFCKVHRLPHLITHQIQLVFCYLHLEAWWWLLKLLCSFLDVS